jgi:AcrR family transcriptional regulator
VTSALLDFLPNDQYTYDQLTILTKFNHMVKKSEYERTKRRKKRLPSQGELVPQAGEERSKRQIRADRILDAALELLQRWGYKKTTIDDIAKQAGVAKGTVYLHWKTREALFSALSFREWTSIMEEFKLRLKENPAGATLSGLTRIIITISANNPLLRAALQQDTEMLGDLAHSELGQETLRLRLGLTQTYLDFLRSKRLIRDDLDPQTQIRMLVAIIMGFFVTNQFLPPDFQFTSDELIDSVTETIHRTFEPAETPDPQALVEGQQALSEMLDNLILAVTQKYKEMSK